LEDVLQEIEQLLRAEMAVRGPHQDAHLTVVEAMAAPYALAFLFEIRRLDEMVKSRPTSGGRTRCPQ
jgi:hypothetical protein